MKNDPDYRKMLRDAGLRVTPQRASIITILSETDDHPNVEDLYEKTRALDDTVSVATVYRTMSVLENAGLVRKLVMDDAPARYEMMPHIDHDHLDATNEAPGLTAMADDDVANGCNVFLLL